jgi:hypothetical protein
MCSWPWHYLKVSGQLHALEDEKSKRKILPMPGLDLRSLGHPANCIINILLSQLYNDRDRLRGLVVRVPGYRSRGLGSRHYPIS